jgi:uncharacterized repeat protein (TIGR03803 family)
MLYAFCSERECRDGAFPNGPLVIGGDGSLFGTTIFGGRFGKGTAFRFSGGTLQKLHIFCRKDNCTDGAYPIRGVLMGPSGDLFGTTTSGGKHGYGTVFRLAP